MWTTSAADRGSLLKLYRRLIELRRELGAGFGLSMPSPAWLRSSEASTTSPSTPRPSRGRFPQGELVLATHDGGGLPAHAAWS